MVSGLATLRRRADALQKERMFRTTLYDSPLDRE